MIVITYRTAILGNRKVGFMTPALFWDITQRQVVILYRRFGTTYRPHIPGSRSPVILYRRCGKTYRSHLSMGQEILGFIDPCKDGTDRLSRNIGKGLPLDAA